VNIALALSHQALALAMAVADNQGNALLLILADSTVYQMTNQLL
jgi:hypothetical protein